MAEKITTGDTYFRIIDVTFRDDDLELQPFDLSEYGDNYVSIKQNRSVKDVDAYIFKRIPIIGDPKEGKLLVRLTPEETELLPYPDEEDQTRTLFFQQGGAFSSDDSSQLMMFVQIGSKITAETHEVSALKVKTRKGGIEHHTSIYEGYNMGCIYETVGWVFDAGKLCEPIEKFVDFDTLELNIFFNGGYINDEVDATYDMGQLSENVISIFNMGMLNECLNIESC